MNTVCTWSYLQLSVQVCTYQYILTNVKSQKYIQGMYKMQKSILRCTLYVLLLCFVHTLYVLCLYIIRTVFVLCTYKLHHFQNSLKAVCTEYILCSSVHLTESVPAAYSKSIKAFIPIITLSVLHPCPLQKGLLAAAGGSAGSASALAALAVLAFATARPRRPRWPPPQRDRAGCAGLRCSARPCCRTEGASE